MHNPDGLQVSGSYRNIIKIALPISVAILIPQLNILTNTIFLGYYQPAGMACTTSDLLAASGVAGIYYLTMAMVDYGLVSGILMMMSRKAGENDRQGVGHLFTNGVLICLILSIVLVLVSCWLAPVLFRLTIHEEKVRNAAIDFIRIRIWGLPFLVVCQLSNSFFLAISRSRLIVIGSGIQTLVNIALDYLLIFGIAFFPEMGLDGTALASVISEFVYMLVAFTILHYGRRFADFALHYVRNMEWALQRKMIIKSLPLLMQYFLSIGAWEVFFIYVEHLGSTESALSQIYRSVFGLVGVAAWALASTCNSMVSNLIGQQALEDVIPLVKRIAMISLSIAIVLGLPLLCFPHFFLSKLTADQQLIAKGTTSLQIVVLATWMLSVSTIVFHAVVGTGRTTINMLFEFVAIILYLGYNTIVIEYLRMPLPYAWLSEFVYWFSLFALSFLFFYTGRWRRHALEM